MTTADEVLIPPAPAVVDAPDRPRRRAWLRLAVGFLIGITLAIGLAAAGLLAWDSGYDGRILPGVHVGGVDLSGLDRDTAIRRLGAGYASLGAGELVLRTDAGDVSIPYDAFGRRPDVEAMVQQAMAEGRAGTPAERALAEMRLALWGADLAPQMTLDGEALGTQVTAALASLTRAPVNARVVAGPHIIYTVGSIDGRAYDPDPATGAALDVVSRIDAPGTVVIPVAGRAVPAAWSDADALAAKAAADRMIGKVVVQFRKQKWTIKPAVVRGWIGFSNGADGTLTPTVDQAAIAAALGKVGKGVHKAPVSAVYLGGRSGHIVGVAPAHKGRDLDRAGTASAIAGALLDRAQGGPAAPVAVRVVRTDAKLTTEQATLKAPLMQRLGSWKTWFPISDHNYYGANIWLPAKIIDGTVLQPGQTFEWWRAVGPVTTARGFGPGGYIAGNHTDPTGALGGGMCSSSTTLFNAALRAGLRMGARANHQYYIYRYPLGLDATVEKGAAGTRTMSFTNDTRHPIVIRTYRYTQGGVGWVRYEIWGIPDGRTVSLSAPSVTNVRQATTRIVYVSTLPHGVRNQTEYPANGMDVAVTRVVRDSHGRVIHRETYYSHYQLWNGIIQVGL